MTYEERYRPLDEPSDEPSDDRSGDPSDEPNGQPADHVARALDRQSVEQRELRGSVEALASDIDGIARALIDLNSGLRDWASGVDETIAGIREAVDDVHSRLAGLQETSHREPGEGSGGAIEPQLRQQVKESVELTLYLADQIEDFDRVLREMGDLPARLDGVVTQGVRRTLATRGKLDTEAATAMDEALGALDAYVERIGAAVGRFSDSEATVRKLGLGQVELASRIDSLYEVVHALVASSGITLPRDLRPPKPRKPRERKPPKKPTASSKKSSAKPKPAKTKTRRRSSGTSGASAI